MLRYRRKAPFLYHVAEAQLRGGCVSGRIYGFRQTLDKARGKPFAFRLLGVVTTVTGRPISAQSEACLLLGLEPSDRQQLLPYMP
jgi:hypothetical protein